MEDSTTAEEIYKRIKSKVKSKFNEKKHCAMIIDVMSDGDKGTVASFCVEAGISDTTFFRWISKHDIFRECYRYGCMISQREWERKGNLGMYMEDFNIEVWKVQGASRYGVGKTNRVRVHIDSESTPYDQYKQLISQASNGDFSSTELKQLMETINIGCRAFEQFELQKEVDDIKKDLHKMGVHSGNYSGSIESTQKTN